VKRFASVIALGLLCGCTLSYTEIGIRVPETEGLEIGRSTKPEVLEALGAPHLVRRQFDGELYTWRRTKPRRSSPPPGLRAGLLSRRRVPPRQRASSSTARVLRGSAGETEERGAEALPSPARQEGLHCVDTPGSRRRSVIVTGRAGSSG
jgi:hypothetical protein